MSIETLYERYADDVLRVCYFYLNDRYLAEEVCQDAFVRLMTSETRLKAGHEKAWLLKVALNRCRDLWRSGWVKRVVLGSSVVRISFPAEDTREKTRGRRSHDDGGPPAARRRSARSSCCSTTRTTESARLRAFCPCRKGPFPAGCRARKGEAQGYFWKEEMRDETFGKPHRKSPTETSAGSGLTRAFFIEILNTAGGAARGGKEKQMAARDWPQAAATAARAAGYAGLIALPQLMRNGGDMERRVSRSAGGEMRRGGMIKLTAERTRGQRAHQRTPTAKARRITAACLPLRTERQFPAGQGTAMRTYRLLTERRNGQCPPICWAKQIGKVAEYHVGTCRKLRRYREQCRGGGAARLCRQGHEGRGWSPPRYRGACCAYSSV